MGNPILFISILPDRTSNIVVIGEGHQKPLVSLLPASDALTATQRLLGHLDAALPLERCFQLVTDMPEFVEHPIPARFSVTTPYDIYTRLRLETVKAQAGKEVALSNRPKPVFTKKQIVRATLNQPVQRAETPNAVYIHSLKHGQSGYYLGYRQGSQPIKYVLLDAQNQEDFPEALLTWLTAQNFPSPATIVAKNNPFFAGQSGSWLFSAPRSLQEDNLLDEVVQGTRRASGKTAKSATTVTPVSTASDLTDLLVKPVLPTVTIMYATLEKTPLGYVLAYKYEKEPVQFYNFGQVDNSTAKARLLLWMSTQKPRPNQTISVDGKLVSRDDNIYGSRKAATKHEKKMRAKVNQAFNRLLSDIQNETVKEIFSEPLDFDALSKQALANPVVEEQPLPATPQRTVLSKPKTYKTLDVYTDASLSGSGTGVGVSGWVRRTRKANKAVLFGIHKYTHRNINELETLAIFQAILNNSDTEKLIIHSDSQYAIGYVKKLLGLETLPKGAKTDDFHNKHALARKLLDEGMEIKFVWVKGHSDDTWNTVADQMVRHARYRLKKAKQIETVQQNMIDMMGNLVSLQLGK